MNKIENKTKNLMGIGDWGLGIGDWGLGVWPKNQNPKTTTPNPILFI